MCAKCKEVMVELFPDANEDWLQYMLWNETAWPMGDGEYIQNQLRENKAKWPDYPKKSEVWPPASEGSPNANSQKGEGPLTRQ